METLDLTEPPAVREAEKNTSRARIEQRYQEVETRYFMVSQELEGSRNEVEKDLERLDVMEDWLNDHLGQRDGAGDAVEAFLLEELVRLERRQLLLDDLGSVLDKAQSHLARARREYRQGVSVFGPRAYVAQV